MGDRTTRPVPALTDEHSLLLWQVCAYAEDLIDAAASGRHVTPEYDAMLGFVHDRLLPWLEAEERELPPAGLRDDHMLRLLVSDHERLRADADNLASSRTRELITLAANALVDRLERHVRREEAWFVDAATDAGVARAATWSLLTDEIDTVPILVGAA